MGEQAAACPPELKAAVAISTPFDLAASVQEIDHRGTRFYRIRLVHRLKRKTLVILKRYPDLVDRNALRAVHTVGEFDEAVTAPVNGFPSAAAYWKASSSAGFLSRIQRPTLLINAQDDPFFPGAALPRQQVSQNPFLTAEFPQAGGHVGFISGRWPGRPTYWAEIRAMEFLNEQISCKVPQATPII